VEDDVYVGGYLLRAGSVLNPRCSTWWQRREDEQEESKSELVLLLFADDKGVRIFKDEDLAALGKKSGAALDRLFSVAQRLSGIGVNDVEEM